MSDLIEFFESRGFVDDEIGEVLDVVAAADQRWLQMTRGYPKDNELLPPIDERFADPQWVEALRLEAEADLFERLVPTT